MFELAFIFYTAVLAGLFLAGLSQFRAAVIPSGSGIRSGDFHNAAARIFFIISRWVGGVQGESSARLRAEPPSTPGGVVAAATLFLRVGAVRLARQAHILKAAGSNPAPAIFHALDAAKWALAVFLLSASASVFSGCATGGMPRANSAMVNGCHVDATARMAALKQGKFLKREGVEWARILFVAGGEYGAGTIANPGHAYLAYMSPAGENRLWIWDARGSQQIRAWREDPSGIARAATPAATWGMWLDNGDEMQPANL